MRCLPSPQPGAGQPAGRGRARHGVRTEQVGPVAGRRDWTGELIRDDTPDGAAEAGRGAHRDAPRVGGGGERGEREQGRARAGACRVYAETRVGSALRGDDSSEESELEIHSERAGRVDKMRR